MTSHFALDQDSDRVPVLKMYNRHGRLTEEASLAESIEVQLFDGTKREFQIEVENAIHMLQ